MKLEMTEREKNVLKEQLFNNRCLEFTQKKHHINRDISTAV